MFYSRKRFLLWLVYHFHLFVGTSSSYHRRSVSPTSSPPVFIRICGGDGGNRERKKTKKKNSFPIHDNTLIHANSNSNKSIETRRLQRRHPWILEMGPEYSIFESLSTPATSPRGGTRNYNERNGYHDDDAAGMHLEDNDGGDNYDDILLRMDQLRQRGHNTAPGAINSPLFRPSFQSSNGSSLQRKWRQQLQRRQQQQRRTLPIAFQRVQDWWTTNVSPNIQSLPKIVCRMEPTTTLKLRKTFRPLKTIIRFGADFNTQLGVWQFKSSWEDAIIGSKLTLAGKELQLTKSWQLSVGAVEDLVTRFRFRAAINLQTFQAYARVGFRTERLTPIDVVEGFTILKRVPLDGVRGSVKLEVKANIALPEPEFEYSTETQRSFNGMGDIEVSIDELNLLLDY
jgi:hypothetical protein